MKTKEEIRNHPGFQAILEKAKNLNPEAKQRLIKMFRNEEDLAFLSMAERGVTLDVLKSKTGPEALKYRGMIAEHLNHNRDLMAEIMLEELE